MVEGSPTRVIVAAAHPLVRGGMRALLDTRPELVIAGYAASLMDLARAAAAVHAQAALADWPAGDRAVLPTGMDNPFHTLPVLVLGDINLRQIRQALRAGARGYLPREATADELVGAVHATLDGLVALHPLVSQALVKETPGTMLEDVANAPLEEPLTPRELDVLAQLASGLPNKSIAVRLGVSEHTVKFHVGSILGKLGASSRTEAVALAARQGLLVL